MKKKLLPHKEWVIYQFKHYLKEPSYRNVLIHTALIESIVIAESIKIKPLTKKEKQNYRSFGRAIEILDKQRITEIYNLKEKRNSLVHKIFKSKLDEGQIKQISHEMHSSINQIYKKSNLIKNFLSKEYNEDINCYIP